MLTKNDLQAIKEVVDERLDFRLEEKLKPIKHDMKKMKKDIGVIIDTFDRRDVNLQKRVKRIEIHVGFSAKN